MLTIHVIGPGFGECIVIELPDGQVGVVDSFCSRHADPPVLDFLRTLKPEPTRLQFVALTHPHADHCMGMHRYFKKYLVEEFWVFHSFLQHTCSGFYKAMKEKGALDAVEKALDLCSGSVWAESLNLWKAAHENSGLVKPECLLAGGCSRLCGGKVVAKFLTPNGVGKWRYENSLASAAQRLVEDGPILNPNWDPGGLPHNQASGAILFEYGATRILLMADAEDELWRDLIEKEGDRPLLKAHFIKGSHHGSTNGYNAKIYDCVADEDTVVVLTPFNRHEHPLPTREGVERLLPHVKEVFCTNAIEARRSSDLHWKHAGSAPTPAMPPRWAVDCQDDPGLLSLLAAEQAKRPYEPERVRVPRRWLRDCQQQPKLIQLLRDELRNHRVVGPRPGLTDEFRVTFRFDDEGKVLEREAGWGVGRLERV